MSQNDRERQKAQNKKLSGRGDVAGAPALSGDVQVLGTGRQAGALSEVQDGQDEPVLIPLARRPGQKEPSTPPTPPSGVCPKCKGAEWVRQPGNLPPWHPQFKSRVECECLIQKRRLKRLQELLDLCMRFGFQREKKLSTYRAQVQGVQQAVRQTKRLIEQLTTWAAEREERTRRGDTSKMAPPREWIVFIGPVGVGKTHLAMAVGNAALDADIVTLFATVPDLLDHLRQAFNLAASVVYDEVFERFKNAELLILDDLGAEQSNSWVDEKLFQLLNYRYNLCLPTVVTLNKQAWECLDVRLQSRLSDRSLVEPVILDQAKDFREQQGRARRSE